MSFVKVVLPPNEQHQFTTLCGHVDNKKYDKAIKTADGILKKFPNHGETMALKGLAEHQSGNKEVGYNLARKGLKLDLTSSTSYHVLGVIYRNDRAYHQASKYFQTAMYHDPKNDRILRDLAGVQLHLRQYDEHLKSRKALWVARPDLRTNWVGYALAAQLVGDHEFAANLATLMQESNLTDPDLPLGKWETQNLHSELLLYRNFVLRDSGRYQDALDDILKSRSLILDKLLVQEIIAELYVRLGKLSEAKTAYSDLININPDNIQYHYGLLQSHGVSIPVENIFSRSLDTTGKKASVIVGHFGDKLSADQRSTLTSLYADLFKQHPKSLVCQQMPLLHWLQGPEFDAAFAQYSRPMFTKGVPSLFNSVKSLYRTESHADAIEKYVVACVASLEKEKKFPGQTQAEEPTTLLWVYYFLALHYCRRGEYQMAIDAVEKAIVHSPTVMDVYLVKAKILSKAGDAVGAAENVEKARTMDLADRNLNTLSVKYWLRACNPAKAASNLAIFTKLDNSHYSNIFTMQVMWYERLCGQAYLRTDDLAKALKAFNNTIEHFYEIDEDNYDFFHYGVRHFTMSTFVRLMRMEDRLHGQEKYISAAKGMIKSYLRLDDSLKANNAFCPSSFAYHDYFQIDESVLLAAAAAASGADGSAEGQTKKSKAPPPKKKLADDATPTAPVKPWNGKHDRDPNGEMLKSTKIPLKRAAPFVENLMAHAWDDLEAHLLAIQFYLRTNQFTLALRSLQRAIELATAQNPKVHFAIVQFAHLWASSSSKTSSPKLNDIIESSLKRILGSVSAMEYNTAFSKSQQASNCFASRLAAASAFVLLGKKDESVEALVLNLGKEKSYNVEALLQARYLVLSTWKQSFTKFKTAAAEAYPLVAQFAAPKPKPSGEDSFEPLANTKE